jgi:hypothetical protein
MMRSLQLCTQAAGFVLSYLQQGRTAFVHGHVMVANLKSPQKQAPNLQSLCGSLRQTAVFPNMA